MKLLRLGLRFWITLTSVFSFLVGWVMLAHSPKPVQASSAAQVAPLPTLAPLPPIGSNNGGGGFQGSQFSIIQPSTGFAPRPVFRTGGS